MKSQNTFFLQFINFSRHRDGNFPMMLWASSKMLGMSAPRRSLSDVREVITSAHKAISVDEKLQFYDNWAQDYEKDVDILEYRAPRLAADCLASAFPTDRDSRLILDVACGTGLVAAELSKHGFQLFHGVDGSEQMLEVARQKKLYLELKQCMLGQDPLLAPAEQYDAVVIVGALSEGQVPCSVVPELLHVTKPDYFPVFRHISPVGRLKAPCTCPPLVGLSSLLSSPLFPFCVLPFDHTHFPSSFALDLQHVAFQSSKHTVTLLNCHWTVWPCPAAS
ncbi:methyltransferase-like protein 27 isoform X3 [Lissotriton helveticus]